MYESIIKEVELGEHSWADDFSRYETMLPSMIVQGVSLNSHTNMADTNAQNKKPYEIYWWKVFQSGNCDQISPHMAQIKPDEPAFLVLHICAYCWSNNKRRKEYNEKECSLKSSIMDRGDRSM